MYNFLSLFTGFLITMMISFKSILSSYIGNYSSTLLIHIVGLSILLLVLIIKKYKLSISKNIPIFFI